MNKFGKSGDKHDFVSDHCPLQFNQSLWTGGMLILIKSNFYVVMIINNGLGFCVDINIGELCVASVVSVQCIKCAQKSISGTWIGLLSSVRYKMSASFNENLNGK